MSSAAAARRALRALADPERARTNAWFFRTGPGQYGEGDRFLGIRVPDIRNLVRTFQDLPVRDTRELIRSPWHEIRLFAVLVRVRQYERGDASARAAIFDAYIADLDHIDNWDLVDASAPQIVGAHLRHGGRALLRRLARSDNLWHRRIAIVATFDFIRNDDFADTLDIARRLLHDREDLIHKAVGWMLREVGKRDRAAEEKFLDRHADTMPRTMLRYAIEKFPEPRRHHYMQMARTKTQPNG